jgi:hypothetical protein
MLNFTSTINPKISYCAIGIALVMFCVIVYFSNQALSNFQNVLTAQEIVLDE